MVRIPAGALVQRSRLPAVATLFLALLMASRASGTVGAVSLEYQLKRNASFSSHIALVMIEGARCVQSGEHFDRLVEARVISDMKGASQPGSAVRFMLPDMGHCGGRPNSRFSRDITIGHSYLLFLVQCQAGAIEIPATTEVFGTVQGDSIEFMDSCTKRATADVLANLTQVCAEMTPETLVATAEIVVRGAVLSPSYPFHATSPSPLHSAITTQFDAVLLNRPEVAVSLHVPITLGLADSVATAGSEYLTPLILNGQTVIMFLKRSGNALQALPTPYALWYVDSDSARVYARPPQCGEPWEPVVIARRSLHSLLGLIQQ